MPGHLQMARGREAHDQRSIGLIFQYLGRVKLEAAGVGSGFG
jgi:hypothetical protein